MTSVYGRTRSRSLCPFCLCMCSNHKSTPWDAVTEKAATSLCGCFQFIPQGGKNTAETTLALLFLWPKNSLLDFTDSGYMAFRFLLSEVEVRGDRNTAIGSASCLKWNTWTPQRGMDPAGIHICERLNDETQQSFPWWTIILFISLRF